MYTRKGGQSAHVTQLGLYDVSSVAVVVVVVVLQCCSPCALLCVHSERSKRTSWDATLLHVYTYM